MKFMKNNKPSQPPSASVSRDISAWNDTNETQKPSWPTTNVLHTTRNSRCCNARNVRG